MNEICSEKIKKKYSISNRRKSENPRLAKISFSDSNVFSKAFIRLFDNIGLIAKYTKIVLRFY